MVGYKRNAMEWKKLILLFIGIVTAIGGFIGFIVYSAPFFLYIITIGAVAFVVRHFHDGKRVNVSMRYVKVMGLLLILQVLIIILLGFFSNPQDSEFAMALSLGILVDLVRQIRHSDIHPFNIFGSTYDTFTLSLIGILVLLFLSFIYIVIAAKFNL